MLNRFFTFCTAVFTADVRFVDSKFSDGLCGRRTVRFQLTLRPAVQLKRRRCAPDSNANNRLC